MGTSGTLFDFGLIPSLSTGHGGEAALSDFMTSVLWSVSRARKL